MNQLTVQIQELQDKVKSLRSREGKQLRDSCQPDTRNLHGSSGNVFENPSSPTASCPGNVYARSLSTTHCELVSPNTGRSVANMSELERHTQTLQFVHQDLLGSFQLGILLLMQKELTLQNCMVQSDLGKAFRSIPYLFDISVLEDELRNRGMFLFWLSHGSIAMDHRSGDGRISGRSEVIAINSGTSIPEFRDAGCEDCLFSEKITENSNFKIRTNLAEEAQFDDRFLLGIQIAFTICEYFRVTGAREAVLDSDLFRITMVTFENLIRDGTKSCQRGRRHSGKFVFDA